MSIIYKSVFFMTVLSQFHFTFVLSGLKVGVQCLAGMFVSMPCWVACMEAKEAASGEADFYLIKTLPFSVTARFWVSAKRP